MRKDFDAYIAPEASIELANKMSVPIMRSSHFEAPVSKEPYRPQGYYAAFCIHNKPMWEPCAATTCRRTRAEARANAEKMFAKLRGQSKQFDAVVDSIARIKPNA
jgi:hypothetical protein